MPSANQWNNGMVEKWNIGDEKRMMSYILISDRCHVDKIRSHSAKPNIPTFQYSNTPWHPITAEPVISD
ncbi:MAG: hypothetical protein KJP23_05910, partial [Deltaproteobacteria bacterium]|nr:hypothetical protein [Deltaproteobacteria bacterium]